ncbi:TspO/MBR family protein [[Kitasatospora] papulosa]|uniref:TspO/MBR family protein n=1 Tax=[Kitasatospora] papulosa TaxID=1464011 RepID=UPI003677836A
MGARAVDADSAWYKALDKPQWQPPSWAFGAVWTPLYASVAWAAGRGLSRARGSERSRLAAGVGVNLVVNAAWNQLFFRRRSPRAGLAGTLLLDVSNVHLIRRMAATDRAAAAALTPPHPLRRLVPLRHRLERLARATQPAPARSPVRTVVRGSRGPLRAVVGAVRILASRRGSTTSQPEGLPDPRISGSGGGNVLGRTTDTRGGDHGCPGTGQAAQVTVSPSSRPAGELLTGRIGMINHRGTAALIASVRS